MYALFYIFTASFDDYSNDFDGARTGHHKAVRGVLKLVAKIKLNWNLNERSPQLQINSILKPLF